MQYIAILSSWNYISQGARAYMHNIIPIIVCLCQNKNVEPKPKLNLHGHDPRLFWSCLSRFKLSLPQCNVPVVFNGMLSRLSGFPSLY